MKDVTQYGCYSSVPPAGSASALEWLGAELRWERQLEALRRKFRAANEKLVPVEG